MDRQALLVACAHRARRDEAPAAVRSDPTAMPKLNLSDVAQALYRLRRRRDRLFAGQFSDPSWDLLLDLFEAEQTGRRVSITSAFLAASAPTTTAARCLKQLECVGLIYRERDPDDRRCTNIRLSATATRRLEGLLRELGEGLAKLGGTTNSHSEDARRAGDEELHVKTGGNCRCNVLTRD